MDTNNTNSKRPETPHNRHTSHTALPQWQAASHTPCATPQCSRRKLYTLLACWGIVMSVAVAASWKGSRPQLSRQATNADTRCPETFAPSQPDTAALQVELLDEPGNSMPHNFRNTQANEITGPELLQPAALVLAQGERPLRILQIGDSHVAGRSFPNALKQTLARCLGQAAAPDTSRGVWFAYVARNGATSQRFITQSYMDKFAGHAPDLIILSLGTNEAHSMKYREEQHKQELDVFFSKLREACPEATVLLTTPPGDYLTRSHVYYRRSSRSRRKTRRVRYTRTPNPMSARCADFLAGYGKEHDMPVWNLFDICGGKEAAQRNWVSGHYMRPDRIHFQPNGYELHGKLLGEALVRALSKPLPQP